MPLVTITLPKGRAAAERRRLADAVHAALVDAGYPPGDRFQKLVEVEPHDLILDPTFPDLAEPRSERVVVIEVVLSFGRPPEVKDGLRRCIVERLADARLARPADVMIVLVETERANFAFAAGVPARPLS